MAYGYPSRRRKRPRRSYVPRSVGRVRGRGSYAGELGRTILQGGGGALGGFLGGGASLNPFGAVIGAGLGSTGGSMIADALGMGAYSVKANSLIMDEGHQIPVFGDLGDCVIIKHREFIKDIVVPAVPLTFSNDTMVINPGDVETFPWLSTIAQSFDSYMMLGMIFEFKSTSADIGSTSSLGMGTVIMATDYDAHDTAALSKLQMENMQYSVSAKPSESFCHIIECDPSVNVQPHLYVRSGAVAATEDSRFYDHGNFQIATVGLPTGSSGTIGELWCTYQVAFFKPQLSQGTGVLTDFYKPTGATNTSFWGSNAVRSSNSSLGTVVTNNTISFPSNVPVGNYFLISFLVIGDSTAVSPPGATYVGCTEITRSATIGTATRYFEQIIILVTAPSCTIAMGSPSIPTNPTVVRLVITQLDTDVGPNIS